MSWACSSGTPLRIMPSGAYDAVRHGCHARQVAQLYSDQVLGFSPA